MQMYDPSDLQKTYPEHWKRAKKRRNCPGCGKRLKAAALLALYTRQDGSAVIPYFLCPRCAVSARDPIKRLEMSQRVEDRLEAELAATLN